MYLAIKEAKPLPDYRILLTFANQEQRIFDMKPYLARGIFSELQSESVFKSVRVSFDTIEWNNGADLDPEFLYAESVPYKEFAKEMV
jgi:hypothetical protein